MKVRLFLISLCLNLCVIVQSQETYTKGEITDARDGKIYKTVTIGNTIWLAENMRFTTPNFDVSGINEYGIKPDDHYYPYEEADSVCPADFRIPKMKEWEAYIKYIMELKNIPEDSIQYFDAKNVSGIIESYNKLLLFDEPNPLSLRESGLIQGSKLISDEAMNFWSRVDGSSDTKYHLHILTNYYFNHTHKHHIKARKKKKRKMLVRCVSDKS